MLGRLEVFGSLYNDHATREEHIGQAYRIGTTASLHSFTVLHLSWFGGYIMQAQFVSERELDC